MTLRLPDAIREAMIEHARCARPREACGVLGGRFDEEASRVVSREPVPNAADRPRDRYRLDPEDALATFDRLDERGEAIVGFYHSHPRGPPAPSDVDAANATWPERSYLIVSLEPDVSVGSWRWRDDERGFEPERIVDDGDG